MTPSLHHGQPGNASQQQRISSKQNPANHLLYQQQPYYQHCNEVLPQECATRTSRPEFTTHQVPSIQHVKPEKTSQPQILSRPIPAQHMFKHLQEHNNHHQHHKVLPQEDTTRTFGILGQAPLREKILKPTTIEQIRNQPQPLKDPHQNAVLLQQGTETYRVDSIDSRNYHRTDSSKAPCIQHMGAVNARQQNISSKPTLPQQIKNPPRSPKHQHHNEVLRQEGGKRNYRVESVDLRNNTRHSTDYDESAFQHRGAQQGNTHQHGSNGHQHDQVDHQWHHPRRPSNKNICSTNQVEDYRYQGQMTQEQYHPQDRRHQNQYGSRQTTQDQYHQTQKIYRHNRHDSWRMNHNQYHSQENHHQNYQYAQQFLPLKPCAQQFPPQKPCAQQYPPQKPCRYYQRGSWCPYEENCKFSHGN
jgi:hypothetical protein